MTYVFMLCLIFVFSGCAPSRTMDYIIAHEEKIKCVVEATADDYVMVSVNSDDPVYEEYQQLLVSLDVENDDSCKYFDIGDEIWVYYDGTISNGKVMTVYAITLMKRARSVAK